MKKYNWKKSQMHKEWKIIAMTNGNLGKYKLNYLRKGDLKSKNWLFQQKYIYAISAA